MQAWQRRLTVWSLAVFLFGWALGFLTGLQVRGILS